MGDENTVLSVADIRHLLRRTGFGAKPRDVQRISDRFNTRGEAADSLLRFNASGFKPRGKNIRDRQNHWMRYMVKFRRPIQEKLTLFWHDHFATNDDTVGDDEFMARQNQLLRRNCKSNFRELVKAINVDAAMMDFLDTRRNLKADPNENYSRELLELFTMGEKDAAGNDNYSQDDIVQIARAFTGWREDDKGKPEFRESQHDFTSEFPSRGPKEIFGGQSFITGGEGANEIDEVIDVIFAQTDTEGENVVARYVARRLFEYFCHRDYASFATADMSEIDGAIARSGFDTNFELEGLIREILVSDAFYETAASAPFTASTKKSVKWPVDLVVGSMRQLGLKWKGRDAVIDGPSGDQLRLYPQRMGQELFEPPSVFGWDWEDSWITSSNVLARAEFARDAIRANGGGARGFRPQKLIDMALTDGGEIVDAVLDALGIPDQVTPQQRDILVDYLTEGAPGAPLELEDEDGNRNTKLDGLFMVIMQSPLYQLH